MCGGLALLRLQLRQAERTRQGSALLSQRSTGASTSQECLLHLRHHAYVPDKPLPKTARIQPAPSTDQQFCTATSLLCYGHRGKWNTDTNSCDCTQPIDLTKPEPDPDGDKGPMRSLPGPKFEPRTPPKPQQ